MKMGYDVEYSITIEGKNIDDLWNVFLDLIYGREYDRDVDGVWSHIFVREKDYNYGINIDLNNAQKPKNFEEFNEMVKKSQAFDNMLLGRDDIVILFLEFVDDNCNRRCTPIKYCAKHYKNLRFSWTEKKENLSKIYHYNNGIILWKQITDNYRGKIKIKNYKSVSATEKVYEVVSKLIE